MRGEILRFFGSRPLDKRISEYIDFTRELLKSTNADVIRAFSAGMSEGIKEVFLKNYKENRRKYCCIVHSRCYQDKEDCLPPGGDHVCCLIARDGTHEVLVSQPYGLSHKNIEHMMYWAFNHNLEATISAFSWHYPMRTLMVMFRKDLKSK